MAPHTIARVQLGGAQCSHASARIMIKLHWGLIWPRLYLVVRSQLQLKLSGAGRPMGQLVELRALRVAGT